MSLRSTSATPNLERGTPLVSGLRGFAGVTTQNFYGSRKRKIFMVSDVLVKFEPSIEGHHYELAGELIRANPARRRLVVKKKPVLPTVR